MYKYLVIVAVTFLVAIGGGFITEASLPWYGTLNLPQGFPGGNIYSLAWTIIYILATISAIILFTPKLSGKLQRRRKILMQFFILNAALNLLWPTIFFGMFNIGLAMIEIVLLAISIIILMVLAWPINKIATLLLVPYLAWVTFATYLNYTILILN